MESFQAALVIILFEGIVFILLSVFNLRDKIVEAIPKGIRLSISPAIGLMLINIGFGSNAGIYAESNGFTTPFYVMRDFFGALTPAVLRGNMGNVGYTTMVVTVVTIFVGLFSIITLANRGVHGSVLIGMIIASLVNWIGTAVFLRTNPFQALAVASFVPPFADMLAVTFFKFNFTGLLDMGWFTVITLIITFCVIDMFDTIGVLVGTASRANLLDEDGNMPNMKEALLSDSIATIAGACMGTSTVTSYAESAAGAEAGGRTGLTALTTAFLFLACIFIAPIAAIIPAAATSAALIYVGILMLQGLQKVNFNDMEQMVPVALMLITMPVSGSIGHAIGIALIAYTVIKVFDGKAKEVSVLTYVISALFLVKFFLAV